MANIAKTNTLYRYAPHRRKVMALYKKSIRSLQAWCFNLPPEQLPYERALLRARFDQHKDEKDETRASQLLRLGEEEFWENQHPDPVPLPNSPDKGVMFERFDKYRISEDYIDLWTDEEKAMFPDYMANREKWKEIRMKTWDEEMKILQEWDKKNVEMDIAMTDQLPAAKEADGYPPFWWKTVTRPLMRPERMRWWPKTGDSR